MGFKTVSSLDADTTISLGGFNNKTRKDNPTQVEGYFLGSKETPSAKSKSGIALLHILQTDKGNIGVWGKTDLDRKLKSVTPGTMVRLTFAGMLKVPGKNDMYRYKVEADDTNTITVDQLEGGAANSDLDDGTGAGFEAAEEETPEMDEDVAAQIAAEVAARKARVQALVGGKKKTV